MSPLITLTTDFGLSDSYVAQMKGVLLSGLETLRVVDISHEIPKHNIRHAAQLLADALPEFPEDTIHLAVIDPGVGSERLPILARARLKTRDASEKLAWLIGPNNGLFSLLAPVNRIEGIWQLTTESGSVKLSTFDGRDLFVPAALALALDKSPEAFSTPLPRDAYKELFREGAQTGVNGQVSGRVVYVDSFGNLITNILPAELPAPIDNVEIPVLNQRLLLVNNYQAIPDRECAALINSAGRLEIAAREASAEKHLGIGLESTVIAHLEKPKNQRL